MTRTTVVTAVVLSVACLCSTAAAAPSSHFPLRDGATWKLTDENGLAHRAGLTLGRAYTLRGLPGSPRVRPSGADVQAWDSRVDGWRPFLRLGARAGTCYLVDLPGAPLWRALDVKVASRSATCSDARTPQVRGCVVLEPASRVVADAGIEAARAARDRPRRGRRPDDRRVAQLHARRQGAAQLGRVRDAEGRRRDAGAPRFFRPGTRGPPRPSRARTTLEERGRGRLLVGVARADGDVVDVPAVDAVQPSIPKSKRRRIVSPADQDRQVDVRRAPRAHDLAAVGAGEGRLTGERVGVRLRLQRRVVRVEEEPLPGRRRTRRR